VKRPPPPCPACGSSATLPFESDDPAGDGQSVAEVVLGTVLFFLSLLAILLFFLLSRASLPAAILLLMTLLLYWRRRRETSRRARSRPRQYICLDCSRNFTA
jgi:Flp pilus assembly protein TadB